MGERVRAAMLIDAYVNLLRMEKAADREAGISNQKCAVRAKLEALGVTVEKLEIR